MLGMYQAWGFRSNPFETWPLPATDVGERLLIGREEKLRWIVRRLLTPGKIITMEGANGIGKTSINNVASYKAFRSFLTGESDQLLVPCEKAFQLLPESNINTFVDHVFYNIALTLLKHSDTLKESGRGLDQVDAVRAWLTSPVSQSVNAAISVYSFGGGIGSTDTTNTSSGFTNVGFNDLVRRWLQEIFPNGEAGGVVCVIDNLELLRVSDAARRSLEALRDELFTIPGLRWILCGSMGIVRTLASTPRLQGYLHDPVEIGDIDQRESGEILKSRIETYKINDTFYLPMIPSDFAKLYSVLRGNIRDTLSEADNFCNWVADQGRDTHRDEEKHEQFNQWLTWSCGQRFEAARPLLSARPWQLFDDIINSDGQCSPGDFKGFKFETQQAMRSQVLRLEAANLVKSVRDEEDNRRKTILITSNGWMVEYAKRTGYGMLPFSPNENPD
ncbi:MAG: hypothetical protein U0835_21705 [Isosphaeraceae bacterium]